MEPTATDTAIWRLKTVNLYQNLCHSLLLTSSSFKETNATAAHLLPAAQYPLLLGLKIKDRPPAINVSLVRATMLNAAVRLAAMHSSTASRRMSRALQ